MSEDEEAIIKAAMIGAVEGLTKQVPVYKDLLKPSVIEIGKGLANTIKLALAPITMAVWGYEKISDWLTVELGKRLIDVPLENICTPKAYIVGPAIENLRFIKEEDNLKEMFAQLIANSMNKDTSEKVHPGFVEVLKNLSTTDASLLKEIFSSDFENQSYSTQFSELNHVNLERLGILIFVSPEIGNFSKYIHFHKNQNMSKTYGLTEYGQLFCEACMK